MTFLSEVPVEKCYVGMRLISYINNPGEIVKILPSVTNSDGTNEIGFVVKWDNGKVSAFAHSDFSQVTVDPKTEND